MDKIVRATAGNAQVRVFVAYTKDMVEEARRRHNTSPVCTAALGRLMTAGSMMGAMLKSENDILTLRINSNGPIEGVTVTADSKGYVKGYVGNPNVILPANSLGKLDVAGAVGIGFLDVIVLIALNFFCSNITIFKYIFYVAFPLNVYFLLLSNNIITTICKIIISEEKLKNKNKKIEENDLR